jgi:hypothetical protein
MCGPSSQMQSISASQQGFMSQLQQSFAQNFGAQSSIFQNLTNSLSPILQAGPSQQGFSPAENAALNTSAANSSAAAYRNAAVTSQVGRAGAGGGADFMADAGTDKQVAAGLASNASQNLSATQNKITQANYAQGNQNYNNALTGLSNVAQMENPTPYAGDANTASVNAFNSANTIQQQKNQEQADIANMAVKEAATAGTMGASGIANLDTTGGSSFGEQLGNFGRGFSGLGGNG